MNNCLTNIWTCAVLLGLTLMSFPQANAQEDANKPSALSVTQSEPSESGIASPPEISPAQLNASREERLQWWRDAKLGLFIHWGPASVAGVEISWARMDHPFDHPGHQNMPTEEYDNLHTKFNPVKFDADQWMKLAKQAGFKYVVFTAKHHDGFSNWHTKLRDYNIANTSFQRDICKELSEAAHKYGIRLGWYYSTRDWSHPDYLVGDNKKYNAFYEGQVRELLTDYGKVDIMWFDHVAGNWGDYTIPEMFSMMYSLQGPDLLVNDRGAKFIKRQRGEKYEPDDLELKEMVSGDYDTPEQKVGKFQTDRAWESCMTMTKCRDGGGWSYRPSGRTISFEEVIHTLVQSVTGDGNLLLNVGPLPSGEFPADQVAILESMGQWLHQNGESLYGTRGGPVPNGKWGGTTQLDNKIYVHILNWPADGSPLVLSAPDLRIANSKGLNVDQVTVKKTNAGIEIDVPVEQRDEIDSIVVLETE
ncbi:Alpha-L-fucosidase [Novipirellula aureliae]|uniref:alpha-L-fucosidase n=1 Tax=Novipirellula aureliae TaxID=2527966 RepID=A0A5C6DRM5_9BACT|nr:alpha-L-fucosidase [Novipirellula aureliae]TWU38864.1 Alpha-L-fucosidase [Novipirellula aureliae]